MRRKGREIGTIQCLPMANNKERPEFCICRMVDNRTCMVAGVVDGERPMCFLWSRSSGHATILMGSELSGPGDDLPCDCVLHIALFFSYAVGADADGTVELAAAASDFVCRCVKEGCIYIHIGLVLSWYRARIYYF